MTHCADHCVIRDLLVPKNIFNRAIKTLPDNRVKPDRAGYTCRLVRLTQARGISGNYTKHPRIKESKQSIDNEVFGSNLSACTNKEYIGLISLCCIDRLSRQVGSGRSIALSKSRPEASLRVG